METLAEKLTKEHRFMLEKLAGFLPERIFDAHAHFYNTQIQPETENINEQYGTADIERFMEETKALYGDREVQVMMLPWPSEKLWDQNLRAQVTAWLAEELEKAPGSAAEVYVLPTDTVEDIEKLLIHPRFRGFKCYYSTSRGEGGGESNIRDFLPESAWQVADRRGYSITLHMMKKLSPADPENLSYILEMTRKYPNAKLILAHCGRGFAAWTILETARKLKGISNVYYDLAAVSEPAQMFEVIRQAGADHVLWGTDYPLSQLHMRPFSCGDTFFWLSKKSYPSMPCGMLGIESLFAFYQAAQMLELSREDVENIFFFNAKRLFQLEN